MQRLYFLEYTPTCIALQDFYLYNKNLKFFKMMNEKDETSSNATNQIEDLFESQKFMQGFKEMEKRLEIRNREIDKEEDAKLFALTLKLG
jgi:hypothetical protein